MADYKRKQLNSNANPEQKHPPIQESDRIHPGNKNNRGDQRREYYGGPYDVGNYASHHDERERESWKDQRISGMLPVESESGRGFSGKGPRSYIRSDERILEDVNDRLYIDQYIDASDIEVDATKGDIILTGTVTDRDAKWRAEDIAESVPGVKNVENRLRVGKPNHRIIGPVRSNAREELM